MRSTAVAADSSPATWDNVAEPLADALDRLNRAWAAVQHLNAVVSTPALRDAYHANLPKITAFFADLAQDVRLFGRYRALAESPSFAALDTARQRAIANELRDFRLGGAELPQAQKARFKAVEEELAELSARFDDNLLDATNAWALHVDDAAGLAGVPRDVLAEARAAAAADGQGGLEAHAAHAVLPAGNELRGQPRAARDAASRERDARVRPGCVAAMG